jgi:GTPase SAR1 family protein
MEARRNFYQVLDIAEDATVSEITKAYRKAALKYHPDRRLYDAMHIAEEKMKELNEAYGVLSDAGKKAEYDRTLSTSNVHSTSSYIPSNATFYHSPQATEVHRQINLPTTAIFNYNMNNVDRINVLLLGSVDAGKSIFATNLQEYFLYTDFYSVIGVDFKKIEIEGTTFHIWDIAGQERSKAISTSYFRMANIILIFDDLKDHIELCKRGLATHLEDCEVVPLTYTNGYECGASISLDKFTPGIINMESRDEYTAHILGREVISSLGMKFKNKFENNVSDDSIIYLNGLEEEPNRTRPGCC